MEAQLRASLKPSVHHSTIVLRDLRAAFNWAYITPRDASFSDIHWEIIQPHWESYISICFQIEWDLIVVTQFSSRFSEPNRFPFGSKSKGIERKNDQISFNLKGNGMLVFSVCKNQQRSWRSAVREIGVSRAIMCAPWRPVSLKAPRIS